VDIISLKLIVSEQTHYSNLRKVILEQSLVYKPLPIPALNCRVNTAKLVLSSSATLVKFLCRRALPLSSTEVFGCILINWEHECDFFHRIWCSLTVFSVQFPRVSFPSCCCVIQTTFACLTLRLCLPQVCAYVFKLLDLPVELKYRDFITHYRPGLPVDCTVVCFVVVHELSRSVSINRRLYKATSDFP